MTGVRRFEPLLENMSRNHLPIEWCLGSLSHIEVGHEGKF